MLAVGDLDGRRHGCDAEGFRRSPDVLLGLPTGWTLTTQCGRAGNSSQANSLLPRSNRTVPSNCSQTVNFRFTKANFRFSSVS